MFFENTRCLHCATELGFDWKARAVVARGETERCANATVAGCNWLVTEPGALCESCGLTRTRPADSDATGLEQLAGAEGAKRRLLFELGELGLWPVSNPDIPELVFDLLSSERRPVATGHADGLITLDLAEADDAHREVMRQQLQEPYRTVLGHFRHEIGHYYWPLLSAGEDALERCRAAFGDERADYGEALDRHYEQGPPEHWGEHHVSAYATMHPWEDWAETFAHFLHIRDVMQTAVAWGLTSDADRPLRELIDRWLPLSYALNEINRSLGHGDLYPYILTPTVVDKLALVDDLARSAASRR